MLLCMLMMMICACGLVVRVGVLVCVGFVYVSVSLCVYLLTKFKKKTFLFKQFTFNLRMLIEYNVPQTSLNHQVKCAQSITFYYNYNKTQTQ